MKLYPDWDSHSAFSEGVQNNKQTITMGTDYGCPLKPFLNKIPNFWAWADNLDRYFVAFCSFFPCSLTVFHRGRQQKSRGRQ